MCRVPKVSPRAGMPCPVGALRKATQPHLIATHPIAAHPIAPPRRQRDLGRSAPWRRTPLLLARSAKAHPSQSLLSARRTRSRGASTRDAPFEGLAYRAMRRSFRTHRLGVSRTQGFTLGWYAVPRWGTPETRPTTPHRSTPSQHPIAAPHRTTLAAAGWRLAKGDGAVQCLRQ